METEAFTDLLNDIKTLKITISLSLSSQEITSEQAIQLAQALAENHTITELDIGYNHIGDAGAKALALNQTITSLDLSNNDIGDEGAQALALNKTITTLGLAGNQIGDEGAKELAQNQSIITLYLASNHIGEAGAQALAQNQTITTLGLNDNHIEKAIEEICSNQVRNNVNIWALHVAAAKANSTAALAQLLTVHPQEINHQNGSGRTPLHIACEEGHLENVRVLLSALNIDINLVQNQGKTALLIAAQKRNKEMVLLLLSHPHVFHNIQIALDWAELQKPGMVETAELIKRVYYQKCMREIIDEQENLKLIPEIYCSSHNGGVLSFLSNYGEKGSREQRVYIQNVEGCILRRAGTPISTVFTPAYLSSSSAMSAGAAAGASAGAGAPPANASAKVQVPL